MRFTRYSAFVFTAICGALLLGILEIPTAAQGGNTFQGRLSKVPVDAKAVPIMVGTGHAKGTLQGAKLTVTGNFEGLGSNATIAQLHTSHNAGIRGPVIADLTVTKAAKGTLSGTVDLKPDQVDSLKKGHLYVQIHTEAGPEGHLWGWLLP